MKQIVILYHSNCPDGFSAAWVAWKKFKNRASYIPMDYQASPPKGLKDKEVYLLDFSFKPEITKKIIKENKKVVLIDHHRSAKESARLIKEKLFNMRNSGACLSWRYFHPKEKIPRLLLHIEDVDLWKFRKKNTREISAALSLQNFTFKAWDEFARNLEEAGKRKEIIKTGKIILDYEKQLIKKFAGKAWLVEFKGHRVLAANAPALASEVGHELQKKHPPFAIIWHQDKGVIRVSLRSNGRFDVGKIAEEFGGGGHKAAAGFSIKKGEIVPWKSLK